MNREKIMIVEDEKHIVELLRFNLEQQGYDVISIENGKEAVSAILKEVPSLILLDLMLPGKDGIEICREVKQNRETRNIPIIMLTAKGEEFDKVLGLEMGADDYITKPFGIKELIARVRAVLRRMQHSLPSAENILSFGEIHIDVEGFEVYKKERKIELTLKEYELLKLLAMNQGKVLTRDFLLDEIWGYEYLGDTRTVDVHIRNLRKKLGDRETQEQYIETIRGVGYRIRS